MDGRGFPFLTFTGMSLPEGAGGAAGAAGAVPAATGVNPSLDVTLTSTPTTRVARHEPRRQRTDGFESAGDPSVAPAGTAAVSVWRPVTPTAPRRAATASSPTMRASPWHRSRRRTPLGRLFVTWALFSGSGRSPIDLAYSDDDGRTWDQADPHERPGPSVRPGRTQQPLDLLASWRASVAGAASVAEQRPSTNAWPQPSIKPQRWPGRRSGCWSRRVCCRSPVPCRQAAKPGPASRRRDRRAGRVAGDLGLVGADRGAKSSMMVPGTAAISRLGAVPRTARRRPGQRRGAGR